MTIDSNATEEEQKAIEELQAKLKDQMDKELLDDENYFLRFIRAKDGSVKDAEKAIQQNLEWRKKYDIKNIQKFKTVEVLEKYLPYPIIGCDKEGCVLRYCPTGKMDLSGIFSSITRDQLLKHTISEFERETEELKKQTEKLGKNVDQCVYIYDMGNLSFAHATDKRVLQYGILMLNTFLSNYPGRIKRAFVINTPIYFNIIYSIMKAVIPGNILSKIQLYSDDSYKKDLLEAVDADTLPKFLGGNRTDPDGNALCTEIIDHCGEKVPEKYHISKNRTPLSKVKGIKKVTLAKASFHEDFLEVKEAGSFLEWEFETKCRDIGFGLFYQEIVDGEEKITELVPIQRIDTAEYPETGTFRCDTAGTYVIVFDNTYSWVRSKEIYFRTKVVTPAEHEAEMAN